MRVRWRNMELPNRVERVEDKSTDDYCEFIIEPFELGYGHTIGNALRRVLLSSIEGCAISSVKIEGVEHEYSSIPGVMEDVTDIILNIKKIRIKTEEPTPLTLTIDVNKKGVVTGEDITTESKAEIVNKDLVIAKLSNKTHFKVEMEVNRGRGYITADENLKEPQEIGVIPVASIFSPVIHVNYRVETTRVGKITNYDRLIMTVKTDKTISPEMALVEASKILRKHLNPFVQYFEMGKDIAEEAGAELEAEVEAEVEQVQESISIEDKEKLIEKLALPIETLELSMRPSNCLSSDGITTIRELVIKTENDLFTIRNFGKKSLKEIKEKLKTLDLSLGMNLPDVEN